MDPKVLLVMVSLCFFLQLSSGKESLLGLAKGSSSTPFDPSRVTQIAWSPRAFVYKGFLTDEECAHLISLAQGKLVKSLVADDKAGQFQFVVGEHRTSSGMFLAIAQDEIVAGIEAKIATWTFLPQENGENLQILHYGIGQKYEPHVDYLYDNNDLEVATGNRVATVLMYMSDVEKGGETVFPGSHARGSDNKTECASYGYAVKARKGDALLFFSLHPNMTVDPSSLHGSCPVITGEKWSATKWIHTRSLVMKRVVADGVCADENPSCPGWALEGECEKNPLYLMGSEYNVGYCRKSCGMC
ncbi:probable prolyl 4-hydroxylase 6 [Henckelia pumila]|uniref:probable prolyl 4-hydroxylase 6 n=1 Tax=Henckelia pumila TaxID=405737 RepID=UPI003C6E0C2A